MQSVFAMLGCLFYPAVFSLITGAMSQAFTSSTEMNITSCPITYYGQQYDRVFLAFSSSRFALCFNAAYTPGMQNDCILMSGGTADRGDLEILTRDIPTGSGVHELLPTLKSAGKCVNVIPLKDSQESDIEQIELGNFGPQAILAIKTYSGYTHSDLEADAQVNGLTVSKQTFQAAQTSVGVITDVSGCRHAGVVYKTDSTAYVPSICSTVTCGADGVATAVSDCDATEHCDGSGGCVFNSICAVTGSSIIDFLGRGHSVPDRCGYTLLKSTPIAGLQVFGVFQERRRKDVSFVERMILKLESTGAHISLEQGGKVLVNNEEVQGLGAQARVVQGVKLSKDQTGVTAKISGPSYTVFVYFDGEVALIHMTGPSGTQTGGLCGSISTSLSTEKEAQHCQSGCEEQHSETVDNTVDTATATEWCNDLKKAPFSACNAHIDPEPYVTACIDMVSKYPALDGLRCQFLEAYARSCGYHSKVKLEGWESSASCSGHDLCQNMYCSENEFCGLHYNGQHGCICRAIFASKYEPTGAFGEPTTCKEESASISLANCLLEDQNIDYTNLQLNDPTCQGEMDSKSHMVTFHFDSAATCGTLITANDTQILYKNTIMTPGSSPVTDMISRQSQVQIDFSCFYNQPDVKSFGITLQDSSVSQQVVSRQWIYTLTMEAYINPETKQALGNSDRVKLNEKIWVDLRTEGLNGGMVVVVAESCWATNDPSPSAGLRYDLIKNGCPNPLDKTIQVVENGRGTSATFYFGAFQFTGTNRNVFLHCKVKLCIKSGSDCIPTCGHSQRRRRSLMPKYEEHDPVLINLAWTY